MRRDVTGYALLRFDDLLPLQFGLIDVRKALDVQQKALEIAAVLRDLRNAAPAKLRQVLAGRGDTAAAADCDATDRGDWRWLVSVDDSTVDRSSPSNAREANAHRTIAMLQGLVIGDAKRIFRIAPVLVHPRRSRLYYGVRHSGLQARQAIYDFVSKEVPDFPAVRQRTGALAADTLLMSDAWATGRYAQRAALVAEKHADTELIADLRRKILRRGRFKKMSEAIEGLQPRKAGQELADVMETRLNQAVKQYLHRMLDLELEERKSMLWNADRSGADGSDEDDVADDTAPPHAVF